MIYTHLIAIPTAIETGKLEERIVWQERQKRAEAKVRAETVARQAEIHRIELVYLQRDAKQAEALQGLEQALQEARNAEATLPPCRPGVPRSVSERLDRVGRTGTSADPAKSDAPLR